MQADAAGHDRTEPKEGSQVEDVRPEDDPGTNGRLMVHQCRDGCSDLGCIGSQGSHHPKQSLGEAEALAHPLQPRNEHPTCRQADDGPDNERHRGEPHAHRRGGPVFMRPKVQVGGVDEMG